MAWTAGGWPQWCQTLIWLVVVRSINKLLTWIRDETILDGFNDHVHNTIVGTEKNLTMWQHKGMTCEHRGKLASGARTMHAWQLGMIYKSIRNSYPVWMLLHDCTFACLMRIPRGTRVPDAELQFRVPGAKIGRTRAIMA